MPDPNNAVNNANQQPATAVGATTTPCPAAAGGIEWKKQPGATDADLQAAQKLWADAKTRRLPDGSKPPTVLAMEALEASGKKTVINVGSAGNFAAPDSITDARDPKKGSGGSISFNPNKAGTMSDGSTRDPESSLAHEAYHVYEFSQGTLPATREGAEVSAGNAENQHRKAKGLPQRKSYGNWPLTQY
jgi:hypothetical protein